MCFFDVWSVNRGAAGSELEDWTRRRLGVQVGWTAQAIASSELRPSARTFRLGASPCDCRSAVGSARPEAGRPTAEDLVAWLKGMPDRVPNVARIGVLRTAVDGPFPTPSAITPASTAVVKAAGMATEAIATVPPEGLLLIE